MISSFRPTGARPLRAGTALLFVLLLSATSARPVSDGLIGFSPESAEAQLAAEERFDAMLDADNLDRWMQRLSAHPQHAGSPQALANAEFVRDLFDE